MLPKLFLVDLDENIVILMFQLINTFPSLKAPKCLWTGFQKLYSLFSSNSILYGKDIVEYCFVTCGFLTCTEVCIGCCDVEWVWYEASKNISFVTFTGISCQLLRNNKISALHSKLGLGFILLLWVNLPGQAALLIW